MPVWAEVQEQFRAAALLLAQRCREESCKSVLFSSPHSGGGTTSAVIIIARLLRAGQAINPLIVELNRRRPRFATLLGLNGERGIADAASESAAVADLVQWTASGDAVIAAGGDPLTGREVSDTGAILGRIVEESAKSFDMILVDTPPLLEHNYALEAASVVPRLVLVVEAGRTTRESLDQVKRQLATHRVSLVGAVLNKHREFVPGWLDRCLPR